MAVLRLPKQASSRRADLLSMRFRVERFEYVQADLLLRLSIRLSIELPADTWPVLLVEREAVELNYAPILGCTARAPIDDGASLSETGDWRWRGAFALPPELACDDSVLFALRLCDELTLGLPMPDIDTPGPGAPSGPRRRSRSMYLLQRGTLLFVLTCQLCFAPGLAPTGALAEGTTPLTGIEAPSEASEPTPPTSSEPTPPGSEQATTGAPTQSEPLAETPSEPAAPGEPGPPPTEPPSQGSGSTEGSAPAQGGAGPSSPSTADASTGQGQVRTSTAPFKVSRPATPSHHRLVSVASHQQAASSISQRDQRAVARAHHVQAAVPAPAAPAAPSPNPTEVEIPPALLSLTSSLLAGVEEAPPAFLVPIYKAAGHRHHVPWQVLAAINAVETNYGHDLNVSSAGAEGWMQFMPSTWSRWGVDADHDGSKNAYSPQDAIFAAARYLHASGASRDLAGAIFAYNHAAWYVSEVLLRARMLDGSASFAGIEDGYALPLDARYMRELGRTDDGVDIETPPDGALVYSMTPGVVSAVASDPGGFGPNYPVIEATEGSLKGQFVYYGHVAAALVHPGQKVVAGQPIAIVGHTGDAVSLGHGHIEIGFSDAGGDPLSHHGAEAWTPAGDVMRSFLVALSSDFSIHNE
jgi:hypothetical protein